MPVLPREQDFPRAVKHNRVCPVRVFQDIVRGDGDALRGQAVVCADTEPAVAQEQAAGLHCPGKKRHCLLTMWGAFWDGCGLFAARSIGIAMGVGGEPLIRGAHNCGQVPVLRLPA